MKTRLAAFCSAVSLTLFMAACGGGGGGSMPGPSPNPSPSLAPSPLPSGSPHPALDTDTFAFSGPGTRTVTRFRPTPTPPAQVINENVTLNETVHTGQTFHGTPATDFQAVEVDAATNQTLTINSHNYVQVPASGNVLSFGFSSADSNGATIDENLTAAPLIFDQLPETANASWNNSAAGVLNETDPDGTTITQTLNADGSYSETLVSPIIGATTATENSDGSGSIDTPSTTFFPGTGATGMHISYSAVSNNQIRLTIAAVGAPAPTPTPIVGNIAAWYSSSPTLATDQFTDMGMSALPAGCDAPMFGANGTRLREVRTRLDTLFGSNETQTVDTWVIPGAGPACVRMNDSVNLYYDFTGQTVNGVFSSTPTQTTTLAETIGLQSATIHAAARHPASSSRGDSAAGAANLAVAMNHFERLRQALRTRQARALRAYFLGRGISR